MSVGFIGLGNVGLKLANNLLSSEHLLFVHDLDKNNALEVINKGAIWCESSMEIAEKCETIITCLPSPQAVSEVIEGPEGLLRSDVREKLWIEMSTTDSEEMIRLAEISNSKGLEAIEAPVSGGCHRAATGNIAIFAAGSRTNFERALPILKCLGHEILHIGELGKASVLKVVTNFLASTHLVALGEALAVCKKSNIDLTKAFKGIKISSGNSFVHETESQVILNGSYNINFTMDLVCKDVQLFHSLAEDHNVPTEISSNIVEIFNDGKEKYGSRAWSSMIVKRIEDQCGINLRAPGFPDEIIDLDNKREGLEIV